jgi:hypothetical protein
VVRDEVLDGPRSVVVRQAHNRMWAQMAVLHRLLAVRGAEGAGDGDDGATGYASESFYDDYDGDSGDIGAPAGTGTARVTGEDRGLAAMAAIATMAAPPAQPALAAPPELPAIAAGLAAPVREREGRA